MIEGVMRGVGWKIAVFMMGMLVAVGGGASVYAVDGGVVMGGEDATYVADGEDVELISTRGVKPSESGEYNSYDYVIDEYNVDVVVNENNTFDVTEEITAYFNKAKHGIFRDIPLMNVMIREDGSVVRRRARVTDVSVSEEYKVSQEDGNYRVKIGSADKVYEGERAYTIKYNYNAGEDVGKGYDELYYNIIGNKWDTVIGNVSFSIKMPKEFDAEKVGFSVGTTGMVGYDEALTYEVDGLTIAGRYNGVLKPGWALTVRCELPEGYFVGAGFPVSPWVWLMFIVPGVGLVVAFILWFKYGRDRKVIETVEFYPPKGKNSLEVGFLYKGRADNRDVTSLLIYLANKGYLKIVETEEKGLIGKKKGFKIAKVKDYDGTDENERTFLSGLWQRGRLGDDGETVEVRSKDLTNSFYKVMEKILQNANGKANRDEIFEKGRSGKMALVVLWAIVAVATIIAVPMMNYGFDDFIYVIGLIVGLVCAVGMLVFAALMPKRTVYGTEVLGKLRGFRHFLETAEKEKLEAMVEREPSYFYDILPYTYVLGVSDKWVKKFETIAVAPPDWYGGYSAFDVMMMSSFMHSTVASVQSAMASSPSGGGGSGFSGGGFSGGGIGGGGGGSW